MSSAVLVVAGLVVLAAGAEALVRGAVSLATRLGVPQIVVGLTVVSLGTSLPEVAVGLDAVRHGSPELAVGNIVGTNLVNLMLVLGLSALLVPIVLDRATLRRDLPAMTVAALLLGALSLPALLTGRRITRLEGGAAVALHLGYLVWLIGSTA